MKATFTETRRNLGERCRLVCNQTHGTYVITGPSFGKYSIFCNGWKIGERRNECDAIAYLQRDAELAIRDMICPPYQETMIAPRGQRLMVR